jgi:hypothetical protein
MQIAARLVSYFLATFNILTMSLFSLCTHGPLVGAFQHCKKGFFLNSCIVVGGAVLLMILSVTAVHVGRVFIIIVGFSMGRMESPC